MKKKTLLLSFLTLFTITSCNVSSLDYNEFFTTNYLEGLNLFNINVYYDDNNLRCRIHLFNSILPNYLD